MNGRASNLICLLIGLAFSAIVIGASHAASEKTQHADCAVVQRSGAIKLNEVQSKAIFAAMKKFREEYGDTNDILIEVDAYGDESYVSVFILKADKALPMYERMEGPSVTYQIKQDGSVGKAIRGK